MEELSGVITVIGGGLAGSEAAWQVAEHGQKVFLYEMRPLVSTGAHKTGNLAELICSNSLGSTLIDRANGLLLHELLTLKSLLAECAMQSRVPAGDALAVDRINFSQLVTQRIDQHPNIKVIREEVKEIPAGICILASGPLTSSALSENLAKFTKKENLFFFDALAPIVAIDSIDFSVAFRASRYDRGTNPDGDYINCPFTKEQYADFVSALLKAEKVSLHPNESAIVDGVQAGSKYFFERCVPIEIMAGYSPDALAYGTMRPSGLKFSSTIPNPYAIVQLRQDDLAGDLYNMVGFQTNLTFPEQDRVFHMIPGLHHARFIRFGQMHRNTFLNSPLLLQPTLQFQQRKDLLGAGQIIGAEGYLGNIVTGWFAGFNAARIASGQPPLTPPQKTMFGALIHYLTHADPKRFQPMKANFGLLYNEFSSTGTRGERIKKAVERSSVLMQDFIKLIN
jgi:methylenetetrahydrofolate--tRNA-(uracil-5-)-methyltransferase